MSLYFFPLFLCKYDAAKLRKLPTVFKENGGTVTAGNASSMRSVFYLKEYALCQDFFFSFY